MQAKRKAALRGVVPEEERLAAAADAAYAREGWPMSEEKATDTIKSSLLWGGELQGVEGVLGFPVSRRGSFMLVGP